MEEKSPRWTFIFRSEANKQTKTLPGWQEVGTEPLGPSVFTRKSSGSSSEKLSGLAFESFFKVFSRFFCMFFQVFSRIFNVFLSFFRRS